MNFADRLCEKIEEKNSRLIVGIDPRVDRLPEPVLNRYPRLTGAGLTCSKEIAGIVADAFLDFSRSIIDAVSSEVVAIKAQVAFFECWGPEVLIALQKVLSYAKKSDLLLIVDCKRGDIGTTSLAYRDAYFSEGGDAPFECDCITVNPYLGYDTIKPFEPALCEWGKGLFVLGKTSNPSSVEIQGIETGGGEFVYERVAEVVEGWGDEFVGEKGYSSIGVVVGATDGEAVRRVRAMCERSFLLLPGFGVQGGGVEDIEGVFDGEGFGAVVPSSRSIIYASGGEDYQDEAYSVARRMKEDINELIG